MGFQPSALHRDQHVVQAAKLAWIKLPLANKRSQEGNSLKAGEPHQHKHHLHQCCYPSACKTTSFLPKRRQGNHFARLYHATDSNPAARANLACLDPLGRRRLANLLRSKRLPALPALAAFPRWRSNGLSLEAQGR